VLNVHTDRIGDVAVIACTGELTDEEQVSRLYAAALAQWHSRLLVVDLTKVESLGQDGIRALTDLQAWANHCRTDLKLFNPRSSVRCKLREWTKSKDSLEIVTLDRLSDLIVLAQNGSNTSRFDELAA